MAAYCINLNSADSKLVQKELGVDQDTTEIFLHKAYGTNAEGNNVGRENATGSLENLLVGYSQQIYADSVTFLSYRSHYYKPTNVESPIFAREVELSSGVTATVTVFKDNSKNYSGYNNVTLIGNDNTGTPIYMAINITKGCWKQVNKDKEATIKKLQDDIARSAAMQSFDMRIGTADDVLENLQKRLEIKSFDEALSKLFPTDEKKNEFAKQVTALKEKLKINNDEQISKQLTSAQLSEIIEFLPKLYAACGITITKAQLQAALTNTWQVQKAALETIYQAFYNMQDAVVNDITAELEIILRELLNPIAEKSLQEQIDTLYKLNKGEISRAEIKEIVKAIGVWLNNPTQIRVWNNKLKLLQSIQLQLRTKEYSFSSEAIQKARLLIKNWDAFYTLALRWRNAVSKDRTSFSLTTEGTSYDVETATETNGSELEFWNTNRDTLSVWETASQRIKKLISNLPVTDQNRKAVYDSVLGIFPQAMDTEQVCNHLLAWFTDAANFNEMYRILKTKVSSYPWVETLLTLLTDNTNPELLSLQSEFYSTFKKEAIEYTCAVLDNGAIEIRPYNYSIRVEIWEQIKALQVLGAVPLLNKDGTINKAKLNGFQSSLKALLSALKEDNTGVLEITDIEAVKNALIQLYSTLAIDVPKQVLNAILTIQALDADGNTTIDTEAQRKIINGIVQGFKSLQKILEKTKTSFSLNTANFITAFQKIIVPIEKELSYLKKDSVFLDGKQYQNHIFSSYIRSIIRGLQNPEYLRNKYQQSGWFYVNGKWRCPWLRAISSGRLKLKIHTQIETLGNRYMKGATAADWALSTFVEFFSDTAQFAWYPVPVQSNKPSFDFINAPVYTNLDDIVNQTLDIFYQELDRIKLVRKRAENTTITKGTFDKQGNKFCFLPLFNEYLSGGPKSNTKIGEFIEKYLQGTLTDDIARAALDTIKEEIKNMYTQEAQNVYNAFLKKGIIKENVDGTAVFTTPISIKNKFNQKPVKNLINIYAWNSMFANMNMYEIFVTDLAFFKDSDDLFKRLALLHVSGYRPNLSATTPATTTSDGKAVGGELVTDGTMRTITISDADHFKSRIIANVNEVIAQKVAKYDAEIAELDRQISDATGNFDRVSFQQQKEQKEAEKDWWQSTGKTLTEDLYTNINLTDGQSFNTITSYRKKAIVFGKWDTKKEAAYQKIRSGDYTYRDMVKLCEALKPVIASSEFIDSGVKGENIDTLKVPIYIKNSEYTLLMIQALMMGSKTEGVNVLQVLNDVIESTHYTKDGKYKQDGIDTINFASTVKVGDATTIQMNDILNAKDNETAKELLKAQIIGSDGRYTSNVHVFDFADFTLQQNVLDHFIDHKQSMGSQSRVIIETGLNLTEKIYTNPRTGEKINGAEFKKLYEELIAENIQKSIEQLIQQFKLEDQDIVNLTNTQIMERKRARIRAISKVLLEAGFGNLRYDLDFLWGVALDENGNFNIPLSDPIIASQVENLIYSIVKNKINKQRIAGGPIVQVSAYGRSENLHIRFKDKQGGLLLTLQEFVKNNGLEAKSENEQQAAYQDYVQNNQGGIAYFECYVPMNSTLQRFVDPETGMIPADTLRSLQKYYPELFTMIGYRIPTETKHSILPLKIVGFTPYEAGESIMLPAEITLIMGSDFDVDKMYCMQPESRVYGDTVTLSDRALKKIKEKLYNEHNDLSYLTEQEGDELATTLIRDVYFAAFKKNPFLSFKQWSNNLKEYDSLLKEKIPNSLKHIYKNQQLIYETIKKELVHIIEPREGSRGYNNNLILAMMQDVLTSQEAAAEILQPSGFDNIKKQAYIITIFKAGKYTSVAEAQAVLAELNNMSIEKLRQKSATALNPNSTLTNLHFYDLNSASAELVGIFAANSISHMALEDDNLQLYWDEKRIPSGEAGFRIGNTVFSSGMQIDPKLNSAAIACKQELSSALAASVDTGKYPVLGLMNITPDTAAILITGLRLGMPLKDISYLLSTKIVTELVELIGRADNRYTIQQAIRVKMQELKKQDKTAVASVEGRVILEEGNLIQAMTDSNVELDYQILQALQYLTAFNGSFIKLNQIVSVNSVSHADGPTTMDAIQKELIRDLISGTETGIVVDDEQRMITSDTTTEDPDNKLVQYIQNKHPMLKKFAEGGQQAAKILKDTYAYRCFRPILRQLLESKENYAVLRAIASNRALLSKFYEFTISAAIWQANNIKATQAINFIGNFPEYFMKQIQPKYPNNAFIKAISVHKNAKTGKVSLYINQTSLKEVDRRELVEAWDTLATSSNKEDQQVAKFLFYYAFYKTGLSRSAASWMVLCPASLRLTILQNYKDILNGNGQSAFQASDLLDQFVYNNSGNRQLIPKRTFNLQTMSISSRSGSSILTVKASGECPTYFRTVINKEEVVFKLQNRLGKWVNYEIVDKNLLGNNVFLIYNNAETEREVKQVRQQLAEPNVETGQKRQVPVVPANDNFSSNSTSSDALRSNTSERKILEQIPENERKTIEENCKSIFCNYNNNNN